MAQIKIIDDSTKGTLFTFGFILTVPFIEASVKLLGDAMAPPQVSFTRFMLHVVCLLYTSPSPRDMRRSRMPSSA